LGWRGFVDHTWLTEVNCWKNVGKNIPLTEMYDFLSERMEKTLSKPLSDGEGIAAAVDG